MLAYGSEIIVRTPPVPAAIYAPDCGGVTFTPAAGTRCIYVDSKSGDDGYDGLYPDTAYGGIHGPKATPHAAYRLLRDGHPDWMLLKYGSTFSGNSVNNGDMISNVWTKSGQDGSNPIVIGWYGADGVLSPPLVVGGSARPLIINQAASVTNVATTGVTVRPGTNAAYTAPTPGGDASTTGWTTFTPSSDTIITYVSSSTGNDNNNGSTPALAKATISAGRSMLRSGFPDWLLLRRGDSFGTRNSGAGQNFGNFGGGLNGGRSAAEPMVIGSYNGGDGRPVVYANVAYTGGNCVSFFNQPPAAYLAFVGIDFHSGNDGVTPNTAGNDSYGFFGVGPHDITIEDCKIEFCSFNIAFVGANANQNFVIRRNASCDANCGSDTFQGQGIIIGESGNVLIEENRFIHNGFIPGQIALSGATWTESTKTLTKTGAFSSYTWASGDVVKITGGTGASLGYYDVASRTSANAIVLKRSIGAAADGQTDIAGTLLWVQCFNFNRHNGYLNDGQPNFIYRGNIITETDGVQMRCGGTMVNNLSLRNAFHFQFGVGTLPERDPTGTTGLISGNIALDGGPDFSNSGGSPEGGRGSAYILGNTNGVTARYNIAANNTTGTGPAPWILGFDNGHGAGVGLRNTTLDHNLVYGWSGSAGHGGSGAQSGGIVSFWEDLGRTTNNNGVIQTSMLINFIFTNNDMQGTVDAAYLVNLDQPNVTLSQITAGGNRYYRSSGSNAALFRDNNGDRSLAQFKTDTNDSTSTLTQVAYTDPTHATIQDYFASVGTTLGVTPDGSMQAYCDALRNMDKTNWVPALMPTYGGPGAAAGVGYNGYLPGNVANGPLRWLRQKFSTTAAAMGVSVTLPLSPASGTHNGGTTVVITGAGFLQGNPSTDPFYKITFGGVQVQSFVVNSDTQITAVTDSHGAGVVDVTIDNGDGIYTAASAYTYT